MGFRDYCKQTDNIKEEQNYSRTKNVEELYDKYKDKSQDDLVAELFKNVEEQKKDGTFNYDGLVKTIEKVSPFLTKEQNLKIKEILKKIQ